MGEKREWTVWVCERGHIRPAQTPEVGSVRCLHPACDDLPKPMRGPVVVAPVEDVRELLQEWLGQYGRPSREHDLSERTRVFLEAREVLGSSGRPEEESE